MTSTVKIGHSDVMTTPLGLGTNAVGGYNLFPNLDDNRGKEMVRAAINSGINLLDTAYVYGLGRSETLIGEVLRDYKREDVTIATKAAQDPSLGKNAVNNSPAFLKKAVDESLERLHTDYLDIFFIHFPDEKTPKDEAVSTLNDLKRDGKIRAIGISNFTLDQVKEANRDGYVDVVEDQYSLIHRDAEVELLPYLQQNGISFIPYFPLASGLLTGKYTAEEPHFPDGDLRQNDYDFKGDRYQQIIGSVDSLIPMAKKYDVTITQLILAWYIKNPAISVVIPGAKRPEQVMANAQSMTVNLSDADYQIIDTTFKA
ncbi:aldo/keto reductase [Levilactobacillus bambusae]|uniref:Oxidoreductase n=1 Tax=Levilactobacillus bambusae TaxID=2024736 RepID=A0A2V1MYC4_9LACO|nr:aldo/keto reductase [Levilactobacillus bambusae]PWF99821.1 oxidoreductase [Levilactobacillus bambusae]